MRALRNVHAITVLLAGLVLLILVYGRLRLALAVIVLIICLQAWSLDQLRVLIGQREPRP